jgi:hypothetical protein
MVQGIGQGLQTMNPYQHTHRVTSLVHETLLQWARDLLLHAGVESIRVYGRMIEHQGAGSHLVMLPYQMGPWPKMIESSSPFSMLGSLASKDRQAAVPEIWKILGTEITHGLMQSYPLSKPKGNRPQIPLPLAPLSRLPAPLRRWYEDQGENESALSWMVGRGNNSYGRIPSFTWQPPITLRTRYLCIGGDDPVDAADPQSAQVPAGLPALSVITLGVQRERAIIVEMPAYSLQPEMVSYIVALAESIGGEEEVKMKALIDAGGKPRKTKVALLPVPDLPSEDFSQILRSMDRPLQPVVHLAIQVKVGHGPLFAPSVTPDIKTHKEARDPSEPSVPSAPEEDRKSPLDEVDDLEAQ